MEQAYNECLNSSAASSHHTENKTQTSIHDLGTVHLSAHLPLSPPAALASVTLIS